MSKLNCECLLEERPRFGKRTLRLPNRGKRSVQERPPITPDNLQKLLKTAFIEEAYVQLWTNIVQVLAFAIDFLARETCLQQFLIQLFSLPSKLRHNMS